jgi:phosphoribosylformylglycinamidine (FGAM) synthase-like amidotransferase family enzyme
MIKGLKYPSKQLHPLVAACRLVWLRVEKFPSILFSLYVDMPVSSCHGELALYTDDMAITATSSQPALLIKYQETYLRDLEWWLRK